MEKLKPCPFCGLADKMKVWKTVQRAANVVIENWRVSCDRSGDNTGRGGSSGAYRDRKEAIKAWNRRSMK